jgi:hypothetical protein
MSVEPESGSAGAELAAALRGAEERLSREAPRSVRVRGWDDEALATVLVAAKLQLPIELESGDPEPADPAQAAHRRIMHLLASPPGTSTLAPR